MGVSLNGSSYINNAGDVVAFSATGLPSGLSINSTTGVISGTYTNLVGSDTTANITVTATDTSFLVNGQNPFVSESFTLNVDPLFLSPTAIGTQTDYGDIAFGPLATSAAMGISLTNGHYINNAGDVIAFSATGLPSGLSINSTTGVISGTYTNLVGSDTTANITVTATDTSFLVNGQNPFVSESFTLNLDPLFLSPTAIGTQTDYGDIAFGPLATSVAMGVSLNESSYINNAGDVVAFSATGLPSGLSINSTTGVISGTYTNLVGSDTTANITVTATDTSFLVNGQNPFVSENFTLNLDPLFLSPTAIGTQTDYGDIAFGPLATSAAMGVSLNGSSYINNAGDVVAFSATGLPSGLSINSTTGVISGTYTNLVGSDTTANITVTATDTSFLVNGQNPFVSESFTLNVDPLFLSPTAIGTQTDYGDIAFGPLATSAAMGISLTNGHYVNNAADVVAFSATGLPSGLSINSTTGVISGTYTNLVGSDTTANITVTATDTSFLVNGQNPFVSENFTLNLDPLFLSPTAIGTQTDYGDIAFGPLTTSAAMGVSLNGSSYINNAGDVIAFSATGLPSGLSINSTTGVISGTYTNLVGSDTTANITVTATDTSFLVNGQNPFVSESFTLNVDPLFLSPTAIGTQTDYGDIAFGPLATSAAMGISLTNGHYINNAGDVVAFSATGLPSGLSINSTTGVISGTYTNLVGSDTTANITVTATDTSFLVNGQNPFVSESFTLNVDPLFLSPTAIGTQTDYGDIAFGPLATSAAMGISLTNGHYINNAGDVVAFSATGLPSGLSINSTTGVISGTYTNLVGSDTTANITVTATDTSFLVNGQNPFVSESFTLNLDPLFLSPTAIGTQTDYGDIAFGPLATSAAMGISLTNGHYINNAGDVVAFSATGLPSGLNINSTTGVISGSYTNLVGSDTTANITVTATDTSFLVNGQNPFVSESFTLNVDPLFLSPTAIGTQTDYGDIAFGPLATSVAMGVSLNGSSYINNAGDVVAFSATGLPSGLSINSTTGVISGTYTNLVGSDTTANITVTATDTSFLVNGQNPFVSENFTLNVDPLFLSPTAIGTQTDYGDIAFGPLATSAAMGVSLNGSSYINNAGDVVAFSATGLPSGLSINSTTGVISGTYTNLVGSDTTANITVTATDTSFLVNGQNPFVSESFTLNLDPLFLSPTAIGTQTDYGDIAFGPLATSVAMGVSLTNGHYVNNAADVVAFSATGLPSGLSINSTTGVISGTYTNLVGSDTTANITVTATDTSFLVNGQNPFVSESFTLNVDPMFTSALNATFPSPEYVNKAVTITLPTTDNIPGDTVSYSTSNVLLPAGLSLSEVGNVFTVTGSSTNTGGAVSFTLIEQDSSVAGVAGQTTQNISYTVDPLFNPLTTITTPQTDYVGTLFATVTLPSIDNAGDSVSYSITAGALPAGLSLVDTLGVYTIVGTPTTAANSSYTITEQDATVSGAPGQTSETVTFGVIAKQTLTASVNEDSSLTFTPTTLLGSNPSGDTVSNVTASHGTVTSDGLGDFVYSPNLFYTGTDTLTYTISDPYGGSITTNTETVTLAATVRSAINISASVGETSYALSSSGAVYAWGENNDGQLGVGTVVTQVTPVEVLGVLGVGNLADITQISAGLDFALALNSSGNVYAWGNNNDGQLGIGTLIPTTSDTPVEVLVALGGAALANISEISANENTALALNSSGNVYAWGDNNDGQLGNGNTTNSDVPVEVYATSAKTSYLSNVTEVVESADATSYALNTSGNVYAWGNNNDGQLGNATTGGGTNSDYPVEVLGGAQGGTDLVNITQIAAGTDFALALTSGGNVFSWGLDTQGQLGNNSTTKTDTPVEVIGVGGIGDLGTTSPSTPIIQISAGGAFAIALDSSGNVFTWGQDNEGQLGNGSASGHSATPVEVLGGEQGGTDLSNIIWISAGLDYGLALDSTGEVWAWGNNSDGQFGNGSSGTTSDTPVAVANIFTTLGLSLINTTSPSISGSEGESSYVLDSSGNVWAWGNNNDGQLGNGTITNSDIPIKIPGLVNITEISGGVDFALALNSSGNVYAWGNNAQDQLGIGSTTPTTSDTPVEVVGGAQGGTDLSNIIGISANNETSLALTSGGNVYSWGSNAVGQLGNDTTTSSDSPVEVHGVNNSGFLGNITQVAEGADTTAADSASYALSSAGNVYAWGHNNDGQLGIGSTSTSEYPVEVHGVSGGDLGGITQIAAGQDFGLALNSSTGNVYAWGNDNVGQLGDGISSGTSTTPVEVHGVLNVGDLGSITQIAAGQNFAVALSSSGNVYTWGADNNVGDLGDGIQNTNSAVPVEVLGGAQGGTDLSSIIAVAAGADYVVALSSTGSIYAWGNNNDGQLGTGSTTTTFSSTPVQVVNDFTFSGLSLVNLTAENSSVGAPGAASAGATTPTQTVTYNNPAADYLVFLVSPQAALILDPTGSTHTANITPQQLDGISTFSSISGGTSTEVTFAGGGSLVLSGLTFSSGMNFTNLTDFHAGHILATTAIHQ